VRVVEQNQGKDGSRADGNWHGQEGWPPDAPGRDRTGSGYGGQDTCAQGRRRLGRRQGAEQRRLPGIGVGRLPAIGTVTQVGAQIGLLMRRELRAPRHHLLESIVRAHGSAP
jgi:hypothetical protein